MRTRGASPGPDLSAEHVASRSLWLAQCRDAGDDLAPRPPLPGDTDVDVAIIGGGLTGLWTARELLRRDPSLRVGVVEAAVCGYGASGRNGGWASALFAGDRDALAAAHGRDAVTRLLRTMAEAVDVVGAAAAADGVDCGFHKGGTLSFATSPVHVQRLRVQLDDERAWDPDATYHWLDASEAQDRVDVPGTLGALFTPDCAAVQPAALTRGLARAVERLGATIWEDTPVDEIRTGAVVTRHGTVRAEVVVRATEAWTTTFPGLRRSVLPVYSLMIATEPLGDDVWARVGWRDRATVTDGRRMIVYAQRTADGRIAFGGRGAPYHFGSRIRPDFDSDERIFGLLERSLHEMFPGAAGATITHRWGGPLGMPRDMTSSVGYDRAARTAWAGGYVGDGVTTTNLAGRTLADLITGTDSPLVSLPWVGHRSPDWEPEPLRWLGVNAALVATDRADRTESARGGISRFWERMLGTLTG